MLQLPICNQKAKMPYNLSPSLVNQAPPMRINTASDRSAVVRCDGRGAFRMR